MTPPAAAAVLSPPVASPAASPTPLTLHVVDPPAAGAGDMRLLARLAGGGLIACLIVAAIALAWLTPRG